MITEGWFVMRLSTATIEVAVLLTLMSWAVLIGLPGFIARNLPAARKLAVESCTCFLC